LFFGLTAATLLVAGCAKREEPATHAVATLEAAVAQVRPEAEKYAPEELKSVDAKLAALKDNLAKDKYKAVLADTSELNTDVQTLRDTVVSKKTQIAAATNEWTDLKVEVPQMVAAIESRVDSLSQSRKLPVEVKKEAFEAAKSELATMKATWAEATAAFGAGNATEAADKARLVKAKGEELQHQLAMPVA
jgi:predicted  nucleic acid-binding Zn-ribbon protein